MRLTITLGLLLAAATPTRAAEYPLWDTKESIEAYAQKVNLPPTQLINLGNGVTLDLVLIPAGNFIMGTPEPKPPFITVAKAKSLIGMGVVLCMGMVALLVANKRAGARFSFSLLWLMLFSLCASFIACGAAWWQMALQQLEEHVLVMAGYAKIPANEKPAHEVTLSKPFYMGKYVVTQAQYQAVMKTNPSRSKCEYTPVDSVTWDGAEIFSQHVQALAGKTSRLPTEAEWEFACRAGTTTDFYSGSSDEDLARVGLYGKTKKSHNFGSETVGLKPPNKFGLYDMHGNVWQWCQDWMDATYYQKSSEKDPAGPKRTIERVLRGGCYFGDATTCRAAHRGSQIPIMKNEYCGFRIVIDLEK